MINFKKRTEYRSTKGRKKETTENYEVSTRAYGADARSALRNRHPTGTVALMLDEGRPADAVRYMIVIILIYVQVRYDWVRH